MLKNKGFTIIELLIVIGIIAILAAAIIVAINPGRQFAQARNSTRESHAHSLNKSILSYQMSNSGSLPANIDTLMKEICNTNLEGNACTGMVNLSSLVPTYINAFPIDPRISSDSLGTGYWISKSNDGVRVAIVQSHKEISCPENYVGVPGNPLYGTQDFCVMKYEAKCEESETGACGNPGTYFPVSQVAHTPWVSISQINSKNRCEAIGEKLITNNEWMTIARNIESQAVNWTGGTVGSGSLFRGHSDNVPSNALAASTDNDGYYGTGQSPSSEQKRTHILSNGEVIWDIAGNVYNWTDNVVDATRRPVGNGANWVQWTAVTDYGDLSYNITRSGNSSWTGTQGIGQYYEGASGTGLRGFLRGGSWYNGTNAGGFMLDLNFSPTNTGTYFGFRCAR